MCILTIFRILVSTKVWCFLKPINWIYIWRMITFLVLIILWILVPIMNNILTESILWIFVIALAAFLLVEEWIMESLVFICLWVKTTFEETIVIIWVVMYGRVRCSLICIVWLMVAIRNISWFSWLNKIATQVMIIRWRYVHYIFISYYFYRFYMLYFSILIICMVHFGRATNYNYNNNQNTQGTH